MKQETPRGVWLWQALLLLGSGMGLSTSAAADCPDLPTTIGNISATFNFDTNALTGSFQEQTGTITPGNCDNKDSVLRPVPQVPPVSGNRRSARIGATTDALNYQLMRLNQSNANVGVWGNAAGTSISIPEDSVAPINFHVSDAGNSNLKAGDYTDTVSVKRTNNDSSENEIETPTFNVAINVPFQCSIAWGNNSNILTLDYTSFSLTPVVATKTVSITCNEIYSIALNSPGQTPGSLSAMGLPYTLVLTGTPGSALQQAGFMIEATIQSGQSGDFSRGACTQANASPGACAVRSESRQHELVMTH